MKKKIAPYLLLTPMILIMGVLVFYPIVTTFTYSLKKWKLTAPGDIRFIGLKNYRNILQSDSFWYSMQNTVYILVLVIVLTTILGCLVAAFLKISKKCSGILEHWRDPALGSAAVCKWNPVEICSIFLRIRIPE